MTGAAAQMQRRELAPHQSPSSGLSTRVAPLDLCKKRCRLEWSSDRGLSREVIGPNNYYHSRTKLGGFPADVLVYDGPGPVEAFYHYDFEFNINRSGASRGQAPNGGVLQWAGRRCRTKMWPDFAPQSSHSDHRHRSHRHQLLRRSRTHGARLDPKRCSRKGISLGSAGFESGECQSPCRPRRRSR